MEQFVLKEAYRSCAIVDMIFGLVYNVIVSENVFSDFYGNLFFCKEGRCGGEYGIILWVRVALRFSVCGIYNHRGFSPDSPPTATVDGASGFPPVIIFFRLASN